MLPEELFDRFRSDMQDEVEPYFWSDADAWGYMDWAQKEFVRMSGGIADSSSSITQIEVIAGEAFAPYSPKILKFRMAHRLSDYKKVSFYDVADLGRVESTDDYGRELRIMLDDTTGPVNAAVLGLEEDQVRWISIPTASDTVQLSVFRLPLCNLTGEDQEKFEIRDEYHEDLLLGMKHKALLKHDAEIFDKTRAESFLLQFRAAAESARKSQELRRHKARTVSYGGL